MIKLYDRKDGMAADWPLIAETLFREAFATLDLAAGDPRVQGILHRAQSGAYDRLTAGPVSATALPPVLLSPAAPAEARPAPDPVYKGR